MGLEELQRIIAESDRGDWNIISCFGLPSFLPWSPDGEFNEHHTRAAVPPGHLHRPRVGIRQTEKLQADWVLEIEEPLDCRRRRSRGRPLQRDARRPRVPCRRRRRTLLLADPALQDDAPPVARVRQAGGVNGAVRPRTVGPIPAAEKR